MDIEADSVLAKDTESKGISPLVAAVLLIAVTMTIAGLLAYWAASFVKTSLPETNETETQCRFADFSIYSCTYSNRTVNLILENTQNVDLEDLKAYFIFSNNTVSDAYDLNETLPSGRLKSFTITSVDDFSKISIKTHCPDVGKEKTCTKS
jgi:flagellin-like protein